jgi:hypothetical protein
MWKLIKKTQILLENKTWWREIKNLLEHWRILSIFDMEPSKVINYLIEMCWTLNPKPYAMLDKAYGTNWRNTCERHIARCHTNIIFFNETYYGIKFYEHIGNTMEENIPLN